MVRKAKQQSPQRAGMNPDGIATNAGAGRIEVTTVQKPWGHETIWARTERYVGKILHINAGHELSVQYHLKRQ